jgi:hypothetical protein
VLERSAPFIISAFAPFEGAGSAFLFLSSCKTIVIMRLLALRSLAEIARVYTSSVIHEFA